MPAFSLTYLAILPLWQVMLGLQTHQSTVLKGMNPLCHFYCWISTPFFNKRSGHNHRKNHSCLRIHLHTVRPSLDLPPTNRLVRSCPRITAVEFLRCVDIDGAFGAVAVETCVGDVMFY